MDEDTSTQQEPEAPVRPTTTRKLAAAVDIEALQQVARRKKEADIGNVKPTFLTKKQRQELALQRLAERRKQQEEDKKKLEEQRKALQRATVRDSRGGDYDRAFDRHARDRDRRGRDRDRDRDRDRARDRDGDRGDSRVRDKMLQAIKETYLGRPKKKKAVIPPSQKFKFSFDWEASDDTSVDINPLYQERHQAALAYGRGFVAGVDRREQLKNNSFYRRLLDDRENQLGDQRDPAKVAARKARKLAQDAEERIRGQHWSEKKLEDMQERDWRIFKEDFGITTRGPVPTPIRFWHESGMPDIILRTLEEIGYKEPTPIQRQAIPIGLKNKDLVGVAVTGSGKTCAFVLPMLCYIKTLPPITEENAANGPYAIIMAPTRELAQQIEEECKRFATPLGIRTVSVVGGMKIQDQGFLLREGAEIVIATPGRMFDCIERRYLVLNQCNYIVLDEADRMIDMNFEPQINKVMEAMPASNLRPMEPEHEDEKARYRQTIMFSATMPAKVELMARKFLRNPVFVAIGSKEGASSTSVEQRVEFISEGAKRKRLLEIVREHDPPIIVFCNAKKACDVLARFLGENNFSAIVLHGGKVQEQRMAALRSFKDGEYDILVATDVVGRGIDITGVTLVLNYDMATNIERYKHRVGRTGRAGMKGLAITFLTTDDSEVLFDLKEALQESHNEVPRELAQHPSAKVKPGTVGAKKPKPTIQYAKK